MHRVFVGSDETGYYREPNYDEVRREAERLEEENEKLRSDYAVQCQTIEQMTINGMRLEREVDQLRARLRGLTGIGEP